MKYLISVGHTASGNVGCGAVGYLNESNCTREIAPLVVSLLQKLGHTAIKLQVDANSGVNDYVERTQQANSIGGDMFVEIHLNSGGGTGAEVFTTSGSKAATTAAEVSKCIADRLKITNRGHKTSSGLYVLNRTSMPAMLIEVCFVDSQTDYNAYNAQAVAEAIVKGLTRQDVSSTKYTIGWNKNSTGWWYSYDGNNYYKDEWQKIDGEWYSFDSQGYARCSTWLQDKGKWYYLKDSCKMAHDEWLLINGAWYRFASSGAMLENEWYQNAKGEWFYLAKDGKMVTGEVTIDGTLYTFNSDGVLTGK